MGAQLSHWNCDCPSRKPHPCPIRPEVLLGLCQYVARPQSRRTDRTGPCRHVEVCPDRHQICARGGAGPSTCWRSPWQGVKDRIRRPAAGNDDAVHRPGERRPTSRRRPAGLGGGQDATTRNNVMKGCELRNALMLSIVYLPAPAPHAIAPLVRASGSESRRPQKCFLS